MILLLDTSTPLCRLTFAEGARLTHHEWQADRTLAKGLLGYITDQLTEYGQSWRDIDGFVAFQGPGSFTGLRIGLTVLNTAADAMSIPIIGVQGESWQQDGLHRIAAGENDRIVLPFYGSEPHITTPKH